MKIETGSGFFKRLHMMNLLASLLCLSFCSELLADTFSDFFNVAVYSNQDGTNAWSGDWVEAGDDGSPTSGDIRIIGGELRLKNGGVSLTRPIDLSGYDVGTLTFDYREVGFDNKKDEVRVEIRTGGAGAWTRIVRYRGANVNNGSASFTLPTANLAANTELRIRTGNKTGKNDRFFVDNFVITVIVTVAGGDFADFFEVAAYSNQDGIRDFATDWAETNDDASALAGDIKIIAGELRVQNGNVRLTRELDLSGFAIATLTFDYREVGFDNKKDEVFIEIRSGGAGGWTRIVRYRGANVNNGSASFSLPSALFAVDTELRIRTGKKTGGGDQFFIDNFVVTIEASAAFLTDHFDVSLSAGTFGINCVPHRIKVTVHDNRHVAFASYVGQIQLATSTIAGDWSDSGLGNTNVVNNGASFDGVATYSYALADAGDADFFLDYTTGAANIVAIDINDTADISIVDDSVQIIQFAPSGFTVTGTLLSNPPPLIINDPVGTQTAGTNFTVHLTAFGQTPTDSQCGVIEAYTGNHELHFWVDYDDPTTGTITPTVDGQSTLNQECALPGPPDCAAAASKQTVVFANGRASVTAKYKDVGSIDLNVKDDDFETAELHTIRGSTGLFVVQPSSFVITTIESGVSVANPGTTNSGLGFVAAGESFHVVVEARDAEGSLVPNYGNETVAEGIRLTPSSLVFPVGGNLGSFANASSFVPTVTSGEFENSTVSWDNVGTITIAAGIGDGDYLTTGDVVGAASGNVGRFYPQDFQLVSSSVTDSCAGGNFSYMSDSAINISYTLQARSLSTAVVSNYDDADLTYVVSLPSYHAENSNDGTDLAARVTILSGQWDDGVMAFASTASGFARGATPDGPFSSLQLGLKIAEPDGADFNSLDYKPLDNNNCVVDGDCTGIAIGGTLNVGFGRMHLQNEFGPELAALPMFWQTELWDGSSFLKNTDDHCTQLAISDVTFTGATTVLDAAADTITLTIGGVSSVFSFADPVGGSDCLTATDILFCDGQAGTVHGAPGSVVTYPISVDLTNLPFLQFDWDQDGTYLDNPHPAVNINFQSYRGHDRVIYWQETLR